MKPIWLKISGVNSFQQEQMIDFQCLTGAGLFGIFGPTGSGKSTILDGITLALYGQVARESDNYINVNTKRAQISYRFQITTHEVKEYVVEREFRSDKNSGSPRAYKCKVMEIGQGDPVIIAEGAKAVTEACSKIIGLNAEDFMRTVVLPQGKFSEFLKLEGKQRRNMLERLFHLEIYGEQLSAKLFAEIARVTEKQQVLAGQLMSYEGISTQLYEEKQQLLQQCSQQLEQGEQNSKQQEQQFMVLQEIWKLQQEAQQLQEILQQLQQRQPEIQQQMEAVAWSERATKVAPFWQRIEQGQQVYQQAYDGLLQLNIQKQQIEEQRNKMEEHYQKAMADRMEVLPKLTVRQQQLEQAVEEAYAIAQLDVQMQQEWEMLTKHKQDIEKYKVALNQLKQNWNDNRKTILSHERDIQRLSVEVQHKNEIFQGVMVAQQLGQLQQDQQLHSQSLQNWQQQIDTEKAEIQQLEQQLQQEMQHYQVVQQKLQQMEQSPPPSQEEILELQRQLVAQQHQLDQYQESKEQYDRYEKEQAQYQQQLQQAEKKKQQLEQSCYEAQQQWEQWNLGQMAHHLRQQMEQEGCCPVCGAIHMTKEYPQVEGEVDGQALQQELALQQQQLKQVEQEINHTTAQLQMVHQWMSEKGNGIEQMGRITPQQLDEKRQQLEQWKNQGQQYELDYSALQKQNTLLDKQITVAQQKTHNKQQVIVTLEQQSVQARQQIQSIQQQYENKQQEQTKRQKQTGISDFVQAHQQMLQQEEQKKQLEEQLAQCRQQDDQLQSRINNGETTITALSANIAAADATYQEKQKLRQQKQQDLQQRVQATSGLETLLQQVKEQIEEIQHRFVQTQQQKEEVEANAQQLHQLIGSASGQVDSLEKQLEQDNQQLVQVLQQQGFASVEEAKGKQLDGVTVAKWTQDIQQYQQAQAQAQGAWQNAVDKLDGRHIEESQWQQAMEQKQQQQKMVQALREEKGMLEQQCKTIHDKLAQQKQLVQQQAILEHRMALLHNLERLFRGKRFVEYVATSRLQYISIEASKRLMEITNGNYALEVDQEGRFIIRDNKNGGAQREASTLSGGETFVASLALALALSAEIQLKGTAPLELFFLDEGFGTLDEELLDVVMSSVEQIHHEKLKIGIISHVESIKNRIPTQLIVTPGQAGLGGTTVHIEQN